MRWTSKACWTKNNTRIQHNLEVKLKLGRELEGGRRCGGRRGFVAMTRLDTVAVIGMLQMKPIHRLLWRVGRFQKKMLTLDTIAINDT